VIAAATAHAERVVLEAFLTAVHNAPDDLRDRLKLVYDLHALATIEADRAWFIEHGRLSGERSKAITAMVNRLCGQVREHAVDLVDAFGVPEPLVDVPLLR
jgi:acyl-CoA oxidase